VFISYFEEVRVLSIIFLSAAILTKVKFFYIRYCKIQYFKYKINVGIILTNKIYNTLNIIVEERIYMVDNFEIKGEQNGSIRGIINRPSISGKIPCIIFCHGFMGNKLGHNFMFVKIARTLEKLNIASIRFDFRGSGESDGDFKDITISSEVEDCKRVLQFANSLDYIDKNNINILGFSMGAAIAVVIASSYSNIIKNSILMSAGFNMYDIFISEATGDRLYEFLEKGYINFENNILSEKAIEDAFNYRVFDYLKDMKGNTLIIHGTEDKSVYPLYARKIQQLLGSKAKLKFIKGADHCYSSPEYYAELVKEIVLFVKEYII